MTRFEEIQKDISNVRFLPDIVNCEKQSLLALHRKQVTFEEYQALRTYADDMFMFLCAMLA